MNSDTTNSTTAQQQQLPVPTPDAPSTWQGMTLEELRRARARALVRREVGRTALQYDFDGMRTHVANNGVRALLFSPNTVSNLKLVDYVVLGFRLTRWLMNLRGGRRRR